MTKEQANRIFSEIIWSAEIENLTLSEYLDMYPKDDSLWAQTEKACNAVGICIWEVATK